MKTKKEINYKVWEEFPSPLFAVDVPGNLASAIDYLDTLPSDDILNKILKLCVCSIYCYGIYVFILEIWNKFF